MTTTVPLIYSFPEFEGVAEAVADHIISAQNMTLYNTLDHALIEKLRIAASRPPLVDAPSSSSLLVASAMGHSRSSSASNNNSGSNIHGEGSRRTLKSKKKGEVRFKIAISGGSLIKILHQGLLSRHSEIAWDKWDIYFADERLVPFESPDSNYGLAKRQIFDLIEGDKKPNVFHIEELLIEDPQECADSYEKLLIDNFARKDSVKLPMFDLLLLGCAPDGHIALLFPNHGEQLREKLAWCMPVLKAPLGPENRITLSIPVICHAQQVTFVVEGLTKAPVMRIIMERPEKGLPSSIVNEGAMGRVAWFVDDAALKDCYDITKKKYKFLSIPEPSST
ncbi:CIC11C00000000566 [Sungouiella intermedia]|uniref:CIC11C00000000566 n=1 Tax=Sungouiella intermedia TaxID=45354 RepID=A0A1L0BSB5_9ASCO|nr:CIC11C00000000566 [[Candida] intermedia]